MAPPPKLTLTDSELLRLRDAGVSQQQIADEYNVSLGTVFRRYKLMGVTKERPRYEDLTPWTVKPQHNEAHPLRCLRLLGQRRTNIEEGRDPDDGINKKKAGMLNKWLVEMGPRGEGGLVVRYHPDCPPNPANPARIDETGNPVPGTGGGFWYDDWKPSDGDSYVRMPKMQRNARTGQRTAKIR
jgi:hypothetical protein